MDNYGLLIVLIRQIAAIPPAPEGGEGYRKGWREACWKVIKTLKKAREEDQFS